MILLKFLISVRDGHCDYLPRAHNKPSYATDPSLFPTISNMKRTTSAHTLVFSNLNCKNLSVPMLFYRSHSYVTMQGHLINMNITYRM